MAAAVNVMNTIRLDPGYIAWRTQLAFARMDRQHRLWLRWRDAQHPGTRRMALKAKARGLVLFDREMTGSKR